MALPPEDTFASELLDLHLGRLTPTQAQAWRARIAADPKLAEQDEALTTCFRALGTWRAVEAPADLASRVVARTAAAGRTPRLVRPTDELTHATEETGVRIIRLGNLREIIAVAALIVFMVSIGVPGLLSMRERGLRMGCSRNLALLGQGLQQYATQFGSSFPFAGWNERTSWRPSNDPLVATLPNHRHLYPLLRGAFIADPRAFVCPARGDVPMPMDQVRGRNDFLESRNLSYAYQNMAGLRPSLADNPNLPLMADDNPLFDDGVPLLERFTFADPAGRNSQAHGGAGQNILLLDGHLKWSTTPHVGVDGDNIWTLQGVESYTGREGPRSSSDTHLLR